MVSASVKPGSCTRAVRVWPGAMVISTLCLPPPRFFVTGSGTSDEIPAGSVKQRANRLRIRAWEQLIGELVAEGARQHTVEKEIVDQFSRAPCSTLRRTGPEVEDLIREVVHHIAHNLAQGAEPRPTAQLGLRAQIAPQRIRAPLVEEIGAQASAGMPRRV